MHVNCISVDLLKIVIEISLIFCFLYFFKNYSWFTTLCQFLLYNKVTQSFIYIYIYVIFFTLSSIMFHHKWLDTVPWAYLFFKKIVFLLLFFLMPLIRFRRFSSMSLCYYWIFCDDHMVKKILLVLCCCITYYSKTYHLKTACIVLYNSYMGLESRAL